MKYERNDELIYSNALVDVKLGLGSGTGGVVGQEMRSTTRCQLISFFGRLVTV
jgi:hypothetical protein